MREGLGILIPILGMVARHIDYVQGLAKANEYLKNHLYREALSEFNKLVRRWPDDPDTLRGRAIVLHKLGLYEQAWIDHRHLMSLNSDRDLSTLITKGAIFNELTDYQAAITDYNNALTLSPNDPTLLGNKALTLYQLDLAPKKRTLS